MPREADISLNERSFILQALQEGIRVDGRAFNDYRKLNLEFGDEYGHTEVRLGKTRYEGPNVSGGSVERVPDTDRRFAG